MPRSRSLGVARLAALASVVVLAGCARGRGARGPAVDPAGRYEYASVANRQNVTGTITISRGADGLTGVMTTGVSRDIAFRTVRVDGARVMMESATPSAPVVVHLSIDGAAITGTWQMGGLGGSLRGRRVADR